VWNIILDQNIFHYLYEEKRNKSSLVLVMEKKQTLNFEMQDEPSNNPSFKETLRGLADSSSLHGIPKIASSRQIAVKLLWCLLFMGTLVVCFIQIISLFR